MRGGAGLPASWAALPRLQWVQIDLAFDVALPGAEWGFPGAFPALESL